MGLISQYIVKGVLHFYLYLKYLISDPAIQMSIDDHIKVFPPHTITLPPQICQTLNNTCLVPFTALLHGYKTSLIKIRFLTCSSLLMCRIWEKPIMGLGHHMPSMKLVIFHIVRYMYLPTEAHFTNHICFIHSSKTVYFLCRPDRCLFFTCLKMTWFYFSI